MKNVLVVSGHTDLNDSVANKIILEEVKRFITEAEIDCLDQLYPDFKIDAKAEQAKLEKAEVVVLQFPMFWYSAPSILHRWLEQTFLHGWSHGSEGDKLKGKKLVVSLTSGAPEEYYHTYGASEHEIKDFILSLIATANLVQMEYAGFVYTGGVSYQARLDPEVLAQIKEKSIAHALQLVNMIKEL